jgi:hypothetical protein
VGRELLGSSDRKRLVLGFDAGCFACSSLAKRIEERVGGKIEVRSLRDPQVREWRKRALGEDAPWAPTLIEVEGPKVRAWTGYRMGLALSRALGLATTWRVMQVLGEHAAARRVEKSPITGAAVAGMSRSQFLKGAGGAIVGMSVLSGTAIFPSVAAAEQDPSSASTGTPADQNKAKAIVRSSEEFKALAREQRLITGESFDFEQAVVRVDESGSTAIVGVPAFDEERSVVATFHVDLRREVVFSYWHVVRVPTDDGRAILLTSYVNGRPAPRNSRLILGEDYVITADGRRLSHDQFIAEEVNDE